MQHPLGSNRKFWVSRGPVRRHRGPDSLPTRILTGLGCAGFLLLSCCGCGALFYGAEAAPSHIAGVSVIGSLLALTGVASVGYGWWQWLSRRATVRWAERAGGAEVANRTAWPWAAQDGTTDPVTVVFAVDTHAAGLPVTVGEIRWDDEVTGLGGVVDGSASAGAFAVLRLPRAMPYLAVQRRPQRARGGRDEDAFWDEYRVVTEDLELAGRLTTPQARRAHMTGRIPPWAVVGDEVYTVRATRRPVGPATVEALAAQLVQVAALLGVPAADPPGER
ncbi:hypothetical protein [Catellatospora sichuanensis]|uniref:hypothetical protein n=1 Tax=Catellatospora sichuanensis TaxID=1969805 RepID=UPI001181FB00|nr:hypothetical protein [Catellatospora sichuanensis]